MRTHQQIAERHRQPAISFASWRTSLLAGAAVALVGCQADNVLTRKTAPHVTSPSANLASAYGTLAFTMSVETSGDSRPRARTTSMRVSRESAGLGTWRTTYFIDNPERFAGMPDRGQRLTRIEIDADGAVSAVRADGSRRLMPAGPTAAMAKIPESPNMPVARREQLAQLAAAAAASRPAAMPMGGKWIDALVSTVEKRASEVSALRQKLGSPARGVDGLDHYRTTAGDNSMDVLVDATNALTVGVDYMQGGRQIASVRHEYVSAPNGVFVRMRTTTRQSAWKDQGAMTAFMVLSNVSLDGQEVRP